MNSPYRTAPTVSAAPRASFWRLVGFFFEIFWIHDAKACRLGDRVMRMNHFRKVADR